MKLNGTFTKAIFVALFIFGCVLPVTAAHLPQPIQSLNDNVIDWWEEFEQDSYSQPVEVDMVKPGYSIDAAPAHMPKPHMGAVIDWSDEFEYQKSENPTMETEMASKAKEAERTIGKYWEWEALASI